MQKNKVQNFRFITGKFGGNCAIWSHEFAGN